MRKGNQAKQTHPKFSKNCGLPFPFGKKTQLGLGIGKKCLPLFGLALLGTTIPRKITNSTHRDGARRFANLWGGPRFGQI
jgi:hypothetical protein